MFEVIYENSNFIVVYKPEGESFHNDDNQDIGFFNLVKSQVKQDLFPIHRLDKVTSGLILFAKDQHTASLFGKMFQEHLVDKYYLAISSGKPKKKQGLIKGDMEKSRRGTWKLTQTTLKPAITQFFSYSFIPGKRLYLLRPLSGKTHQLRVALKSLGVPIDGDTAYSAVDSDRVYLHAYKLKFELEGESFDFESLPKTGSLFLEDGFVNKLNEIGKPDLLIWPKVQG